MRVPWFRKEHVLIIGIPKVISMHSLLNLLTLSIENQTCIIRQVGNLAVIAEHIE